MSDQGKNASKQGFQMTPSVVAELEQRLEAVMSDETERDRYEVNMLAYATRCTNDLAAARAERDAAQAEAAGYREALSILAKWARGIVPADDLPRGWHKVDAALSQPEPPVLARLRAAERVVEQLTAVLSLPPVVMGAETVEADCHALLERLTEIRTAYDDALAERDGGGDGD